MQTVDSFTGFAALAQKWRAKTSDRENPWQLRWKPVCASTEIELSRWLKEKPFTGNFPRAFLADRQTHGTGQWGRLWHAPNGGVWLSAAFPLNVDTASAGLLSLAVALALARKLEEYHVHARIKWPNDLIIGEKKLAGFLPRLIHRGKRLMFARVGLGLNVCNRVPLGGISLKQILYPKRCQPLLWASEALLALESAVELLKEPENVCISVENLLWAKEIHDPHTGKILKIDGLNVDGALILSNGAYKTFWNRW